MRILEGSNAPSHFRVGTWLGGFYTDKIIFYLGNAPLTAYDKSLRCGRVKLSLHKQLKQTVKYVNITRK